MNVVSTASKILVITDTDFIWSIDTTGAEMYEYIGYINTKYNMNGDSVLKALLDYCKQNAMTFKASAIYSVIKKPTEVGF
mgnify:CR=1 FL=1